MKTKLSSHVIFSISTGRHQKSKEWPVLGFERKVKWRAKKMIPDPIESVMTTSVVMTQSRMAKKNLPLSTVKEIF